MPIDSNDDRFIARALELARRGVGLAAPNPCVGAVVAAGEKIIGEGTHLYDDRKHAEILALERAGTGAQGATLYLNLEPCCHQGRTGPCVERVIAAGVRRVVASMTDPNPRVAGKGFDRLRAAGIEVHIGIGEREARKLNEAFACWIRTRRPLVTLKAAMTLDGKIAPPAVTGMDREWITGKIARTHVQELRHRSDAIMAGVGTVIADDPLLTDRSGQDRRRALLRVILDSKLRVPIGSRLVASAQNDVAIFCVSADLEQKMALQQRGINVEQVGADADGRPDLREVLSRLGDREIASVLLEGGAEMYGTALAAGLTDKVFLYYTPKILGGCEAVPLLTSAGFLRLSEAPHLRDVTLHHFGEDFALEGYLQDPYEV